MSVLDMWSVCDRCGFNYKRRQLRKESTKFVVCYSCYDGKYDLKRTGLSVRAANCFRSPTVAPNRTLPSI